MKRREFLKGLFAIGAGAIVMPYVPKTLYFDMGRQPQPVLISLIRRACPEIMSFEILGVQEVDGPKGIVFPLKSSYSSGGAWSEAAKREFDAPIIFCPYDESILDLEHNYASL